MLVSNNSNDKPKITVVVAAYNAEILIGNTIQSLVDQDYPNYEIIIVDDASTDRTAEIAAAFNCRLIRLERNSGPGIARNKGVEAGSGYYIAFTDADCIVPNNWLSSFELRLRDETLAGVTGGYSDTACNSFISRFMKHELDIRQKALNGRCRCAITANFACRRKDFEDVGGFPIYFISDPTSSKKPYHGNEDNELAFHLTESHGDFWWDTGIKVKHMFRPSVAAYYKQQRQFAETAIVSFAQFPDMMGAKMNYNSSNTIAQLISTSILFLSFISLFFMPVIALPLFILSLAVHFAINAETLITISRIGMGQTGIIYAFFLLILRNCGWIAGIARGSLFSSRIIFRRLLSNNKAGEKRI
jgi:glycosyltransferase involved in cell wall biosynthesis